VILEGGFLSPEAVSPVGNLFLFGRCRIVYRVFAFGRITPPQYVLPYFGR